MEFVPKWIAWEITRRCNLGCVHCRSSSDLIAEDHPDFSFATAKSILDDIASYASPVVVLSGGEPLLRADVFDIARYGTDLGFRMCLATNGTLVTDEICMKIKQEPWMKIISTKGLDQNKCDNAGPNYRSRLVGCEFALEKRDDLFAATPPLVNLFREFLE